MQARTGWRPRPARSASSKSRARRADATGSGAPDRPLIDWVDSSGHAGSAPPGLKLQLGLSDEIAARLFEGAPRSLASVRSDAKDDGKAGPRGFALRPTLSVEAENKWEDFTSPEVVGLLKGSDPTLAAQHVVLMGHLDHLGIKPDAKPGEDAIYNGALDNAAGVATMLEAARLFAAQPVRPKRSVLFIANTGEERGLLGADYYANHPTVPASSIVGLVDLDMPLLLYPFTDVTAFGADHSTIGAMVAEAGRSMGIIGQPRPHAAGSDLHPVRPLYVRPARRSGGAADDRPCQWREGRLGRLSGQDLSLAAGRPHAEDRLGCGRAIRAAELPHRAGDGRRAAAADVASGRLFRRPVRSQGAARSGNSGSPTLT